MVFSLGFLYIFVHGASDGARWRQDGGKMAQDGPKLAQDGPKMAPRGPKMAPRWPKMGPRGAQEVPSWGLTLIGPRKTGERGSMFGRPWPLGRLARAVLFINKHPQTRDIGS